MTPPSTGGKSLEASSDESADSADESTEVSSDESADSAGEPMAKVRPGEAAGELLAQARVLG